MIKWSRSFLKPDQTNFFPQNISPKNPKTISVDNLHFKGLGDFFQVENSFDRGTLFKNSIKSEKTLIQKLKILVNRKNCIK